MYGWDIRGQRRCFTELGGEVVPVVNSKSTEISANRTAGPLHPRLVGLYRADVRKGPGQHESRIFEWHHNGRKI
jgi:hypothetical protein